MSPKEPAAKSNGMPQRPQQHRREDLSKRVFESVLPATWTYESKGQREYGIDGTVEIFEGDSATGLSFNVQLKGVEKEGANKALIKTTTRNYWKELDAPTLVVVVDGAGVVHYGWSHQFDTYGRKKDAQSYQWELSRVWDESSASEIEGEVRAARAARHLQSNVPIFWSIQSDPTLSAPWVAALRVSLESLLAPSKELTRRKEQSGRAVLDIMIKPDVISVRLHGTPGGVIHYNDTTVDQQPANAIAADIALGLASEIERGGLEQLVADLIQRAIPESATLTSDPLLTGFAVSRMAKAGRADAALSLVERVYFDQSIQHRGMVPIVIMRDRGRLDDAAMARIAERIAEHAPTVDDDLASEFYYNAGNMIRHSDAPRALALHNLAADRFPDYRKRTYWWVELGQLLFATNDYAGALRAYSEADRMGDETATPLLADTLAMTGEYEQAVTVWDRMRNVSRLVWPVKLLGLRALIEKLGLSTQTRETVAAEKLFRTGARGVDVLMLDAIHVGALWRAGVEAREANEPGFSVFYVAAAAFAGNSPLLWFEALVAVQGDRKGAEATLDTLLILAAKQECGDAFRHFLLTDDHVHEDARLHLLDLIDNADLPDIDGFVFRRNGKVIDL